METGMVMERTGSGGVGSAISSFDANAGVAPSSTSSSQPQLCRTLSLNFPQLPSALSTTTTTTATMVSSPFIPSSHPNDPIPSRAGPNRLPPRSKRRLPLCISTPRRYVEFEPGSPLIRIRRGGTCSRRTVEWRMAADPACTSTSTPPPPSPSPLTPSSISPSTSTSTSTSMSSTLPTASSSQHPFVTALSSSSNPHPGLSFGSNRDSPSASAVRSPLLPLPCISTPRLRRTLIHFASASPEPERASSSLCPRRFDSPLIRPIQASTSPFHPPSPERAFSPLSPPLRVDSPSLRRIRTPVSLLMSCRV
ncbi:hypothetical protein FA13DRAFT_329199 [Coprinellus micaceus]|uniref:Uncharacterized protein n=1 Tax=Coprinellus micaceus TaxID=71717 RepID=A0A4Y7SDZ7_COPMI|nr:hypothetical protein FA13DRAFT_329199 [Coprinellus micaceus]